MSCRGYYLCEQEVEEIMARKVLLDTLHIRGSEIIDIKRIQSTGTYYRDGTPEYAVYIETDKPENFLKYTEPNRMKK